MAEVKPLETTHYLEQILNRIERRRVLFIHSLHDQRLRLITENLELFTIGNYGKVSYPLPKGSTHYPI